MRIAVATCAEFPDLDDDGPRLLAALADAGLDATVTVWDDPAVDWADYEVVLVRSTWDYPLRRTEFLAWADGCPRTANPIDVLHWNTDKRYLQDLAVAGVPTVPTDFVAPGGAPHFPHAPFVVKPTVSSSAGDTARFADDDAEAAVALVAHLHAQGRTAMVQPYLEAIDTEGETSLLYLGGVYSHAARRAPVLTGADGRRRSWSEQVPAYPVQPTDAQRDVAARALRAVPGGAERLTYARVDLVPGPQGPTLLELELTEPYLFLSFASPHAVARLARHVGGANA